MYKFKRHGKSQIEILGNFLSYYNEEEDILECPYLVFTNCEMLDMDSESLFLEIRDDSEIVELNSLGEVVQTIFPGSNTGNNIKDLLDRNQKSIRGLSKYLDMSYSNTYDLVHRESLGATTLETLLNVAKFLNVEIKELYEK